MIVSGVVFLAIGMGVLVLAGMAFRDKAWGAGWVMIALALVFVSLSSRMFYNSGKGYLRPDKGVELSLKTGIVYKVVGVVPLDGKYAVVVEDEKGKRLVYELPVNPPKQFVKTNKGYLAVTPPTPHGF